jgi:hypothetical protein
MGRKRKATVARAEGLRIAREALAAYKQKQKRDLLWETQIYQGKTRRRK